MKVDTNQNLQPETTQTELVEIGTRFGISISEDVLAGMVAGQNFQDNPLFWAAATLKSARSSGIYQWVSSRLSNAFKDGTLHNNPQETKYGPKSFEEYFAFLNQEMPDQERLEAATAMFFAANDKKLKISEQLENYELFKRACRLESGHLVILGILYKQYQEKDFQEGYIGIEGWAEEVWKRSGITADLIMSYERGLIENSLIVDRRRGDETSVQYNNARLTPLGINFCKKLEEYKPKIA
ncbi:MAG: hypothetical protein Q8P75_01700 [bacterium]|nr:hypothetical protein [bacterium]